MIIGKIIEVPGGFHGYDEEDYEARVTYYGEGQFGSYQYYDPEIEKWVDVGEPIDDEDKKIIMRGGDINE